MITSYHNMLLKMFFFSKKCNPDPTHGRRSAEHLQPEKGSFRNQRTRSASHERNLAKIKFCWRCHQTGHESFDCTAELQPANWCPRCLESSHWEDSCWVNEQEVRSSYRVSHNENLPMNFNFHSLFVLAVQDADKLGQTMYNG